MLKNEMQQQNLKKWFTTIQLEKEMQLIREISHKNLFVTVDPTQRVVIVKVDVPDMCAPFKRIVRVPQHINIHRMKVRFVPNQKVILIKAPFLQINNDVPCTTTTLEEQMYDQAMFVPTKMQTLTEKLGELELEQLVEQEPTLYKLMTQMRRHLPAFIVPRCYRHMETGLTKVVLDVNCTDNIFKPEDLLVKVNDIERCLVIKMLQGEGKCYEKNLPMLFPRQLVHEFLLPTFVHLHKINWYKTNEQCLRIELPIIRENLTCTRVCKQCW
jgi:hypothetical protein